MRTVILTVSPDGTAKVETSGFSGSECLEATKKLKDRIGFTDEQVEMKPEADDYAAQADVVTAQ